MSTTTAPQGPVVKLGIPDSQDIPRLVFAAPYFTQVPLAELIEPAVLEATEALLPTLIPPYVDAAVEAAVQNTAVLLTGGTMSGPLYVSPTLPTQPSQAASMAYVDMMTATGQVPEVPPVPVAEMWGRQSGQWVPVAGQFLPIAGGQITGQLSVGGATTLNGQVTLGTYPAHPTDAASKQYVDGQVAGAGAGVFLPLSGGTVSGAVQLGADQPNFWHFNGGPGYVQAIIGGSGVANAQIVLGGAGSNYQIINGSGGGIATFSDLSGGAAVANSLTVYNGAAGQPLQIRATGSDTNRQIQLQPAAGGGVWIVPQGGAVYSGAAWSPQFLLQTQLSGSSTASGGIHQVIINSDTLDVSGANPPLVNYGGIAAYFGGAACKGNRQGFAASIALTSPTGNAGSGGEYVGIEGTAAAGASAGPDNGGGLWGAAFYSYTTSGCLNWGQVVGVEINPAIGPGSTAAQLIGLQIVPTAGHQVRGSLHNDTGCLVASQVSAVGIDVGYAAGSSFGSWPVRSDGAVFRGQLSSGVTAMAALGVALHEVSFPAFGSTFGGAFVSNGFAVDGVGAVRSGTAYLTPDSGGVGLDAHGSVGSGVLPTIAAGGTGYAVGTVLYDPYGGIYTVSTIGGGGAVTTIAALVGPNGESHLPYYPTATPPANPVGTTAWAYASGASGCTLNLAWDSSRTRVALNPGGGPTTVGGTLTLSGATNNFVSFGTSGLAAPTFGTRSAGTKLVLYPSLGPSAADFAIGLGTGSIWQSVQDASGSYEFDWYGGTTRVMRLNPNPGSLYLTGAIGLWNAAPPASKPTVTGAKGANAALASLLTALVSYGLVTDSTSA